MVSIAGLRARSLPRPLGWLGLAVGVAGMLSVVPPLAAAAYAFGLLSIAWFTWLGIALLRTTDNATEQLPTTIEQVSVTASI